MSRASREAPQLGLIIGDLDYFKQINDWHGHATGDEVLSCVAARIVSLVRPYDSVGRYDVEEFVDVAPGCDTAKAQALAERLCSNSSEVPIETSVGALNVTMSVGAMGLEGNSQVDADFVIRAADEALYRVKRLGRSRVPFSFRFGSGVHLDVYSLPSLFPLIFRNPSSVERSYRLKSGHGRVVARRHVRQKGFPADLADGAERNAWGSGPLLQEPEGMGTTGSAFSFVDKSAIVPDSRVRA